MLNTLGSRISLHTVTNVSGLTVPAQEDYTLPPTDPYAWTVTDLAISEIGVIEDATNINQSVGIRVGDEIQYFVFSAQTDTNTNFANTDLTADGDRTHTFNGFDLNITGDDDTQILIGSEFDGGTDISALSINTTPNTAYIGNAGDNFNANIGVNENKVILNSSSNEYEISTLPPINPSSQMVMMMQDDTGGSNISVRYLDEIASGITGHNMANTNLTLDANRTHNLNGKTLNFNGTTSDRFVVDISSISSYNQNSLSISSGQTFIYSQQSQMVINGNNSPISINTDAFNSFTGDTSITLNANHDNISLLTTHDDIIFSAGSGKYRLYNPISSTTGTTFLTLSTVDKLSTVTQREITPYGEGNVSTSFTGITNVDSIVNVFSIGSFIGSKGDYVISIDIKALSNPADMVFEFSISDIIDNGFIFSNNVSVFFGSGTIVDASSGNVVGGVTYRTSPSRFRGVVSPTYNTSYNTLLINLSVCAYQ